MIFADYAAYPFICALLLPRYLWGSTMRTYLFLPLLITVIFFSQSSLKVQGAHQGAPHMVKDISPGARSGVFFKGDWRQTQESVTEFKDTLLFRADGGTGSELWRSDGTEKGTFQIKDINPGGNDAFPKDFAVLGDNALFAANDGVHGEELWKTDGTGDGTRMLRDINPGSAWSNLSDLVRVNRTVFLLARDSAFGAALWKTDGTEPGTLLVKRLRSDARAENLVDGNGRLFFTVTEPSAGVTSSIALWTSDGTERGTVEIMEFGRAYVSILGWFGGWVFFAVNDGLVNDALWKTDGTPAGTRLVKRVEVVPDEGVVFRDDAFFFLANPLAVVPRSLWRSDGTAEGTAVLKEGLYLTDLVGVGSKLYMTGDDDENGTELWGSNGTARGTSLVMDIQQGRGSSNPEMLTAAGEALVLEASDGSSVGGRQLWKSEGISRGAQRIAWIGEGRYNSCTEFMKHWPVVRGRVFFATNDGVHGCELWAVDLE